MYSPCRGPSPGDYREQHCTTSCAGDDVRLYWRGYLCLPNLHAWTGCSCRHVTLPARDTAVYVQQLAAPWRREADRRLEGFEDSLCRGWNLVIHIPSGGVRLLPQDHKLLTIHHAEMGLVGPMAAYYLIEFGACLAQPHSLVRVHCTAPLLLMCKRGPDFTIPKADTPVFLPMVMNPMSLQRLTLLNILSVNVLLSLPTHLFSAGYLTCYIFSMVKKI